MNWRERLADWITGGLLTRVIETRDMAIELQARTAEKRLESADKYAWAVNRLLTLRAALEQIAAMETPSANATVRRMAKLAREALK